MNRIVTISASLIAATALSFGVASAASASTSQPGSGGLICKYGRVGAQAPSVTSPNPQTATWKTEYLWSTTQYGTYYHWFYGPPATKRVGGDYWSNGPLFEGTWTYSNGFSSDAQSYVIPVGYTNYWYKVISWVLVDNHWERLLNIDFYGNAPCHGGSNYNFG